MYIWIITGKKKIFTYAKTHVTIRFCTCAIKKMLNSRVKFVEHMWNMYFAFTYGFVTCSRCKCVKLMWISMCNLWDHMLSPFNFPCETWGTTVRVRGRRPSWWDWEAGPTYWRKEGCQEQKRHNEHSRMGWWQRFEQSEKSGKPLSK